MLLMPLHGAFLLIFLATVAVKLYALIDAALRPERNFVIHEKQTKNFWLVVLALALLTTWLGFLNLIGLVAAFVYLLDVRPAVANR